MWRSVRVAAVAATGVLAIAMTLLLPRVVHASLIELTARPSTGDTINWGQLGAPNLTLASPQSFTSTGGTTGNVNTTGSLFLGEQCCIGITGTFDGDFAPGDIVLSTPNVGSSMTINFNTPVQTVGAQIQTGNIGQQFTAEILAFNGATLLGTFTEGGFSGDVGDNSDPFLGVQDGTADITSVTYLTFISSPTFELQSVNINQMTIAAPTPLPATLPLFAGGFLGFSLLGKRRKGRPPVLISPNECPQ